MTTREPGARLVLTDGATVSPFSTAFFAIRPAASRTCGLDVFVQLVIEAMTTEPFDKVAVARNGNGLRRLRSREARSRGP